MFSGPDTDPVYKCYRKLCLNIPAHSSRDPSKKCGYHFSSDLREGAGAEAEAGGPPGGPAGAITSAEVRDDVLLLREEFKVLLDGLFNIADPIVVDSMRHCFLAGAREGKGTGEGGGGYCLLERRKDKSMR